MKGLYSIQYPLNWIDKEGRKVITITKEQQYKLNTTILSWKQCKEREKIAKLYSQQLEFQIQDYQLALEQHDTASKHTSLMFDIRQEKIDQLTKQIELKDLALNSCLKQRKVLKRKLLGWKIGTGIVIGVAAITIPLGIYLIK